MQKSGLKEAEDDRQDQILESLVAVGSPDLAQVLTSDSQSLQSLYPRAPALSAGSQPLGLKQWLKLFLATILAWHLTFGFTTLSLIISFDRANQNRPFDGDLILPAMMLLGGPLAFAESWAGVMGVLILSVVAARMKQSFRFLLSVLTAVCIGVVMLSSSSIHGGYPYQSNAVLFGGLVAALLSAVVFFVLAKRTESGLQAHPVSVTYEPLSSSGNDGSRP